MRNNYRTKILGFLLLFISIFATAQTSEPETRITSLPEIDMAEGVNIHIISPEPIQFVDLSSDFLVGDLPAVNIARIKINPAPKDSLSSKSFNAKMLKSREDIGVITIVGQSFMAQYRVVYRVGSQYNIQTNLQIQPEDMQPLEFTKHAFSTTELYRFSRQILGRQPNKPLRSVKDLKLNLELNNVYVLDDYIFLDISMKNDTNLPYSIEDIKFSLEDKKIYKATNNQSIDLEPVYRVQDQKNFKKSYRNIFVFKKFTYPNSKVLKIRFIEEQLSGRTIEMGIKYSDILNADTF
jgi:conjugative transposon TraN protein